MFLALIFLYTLLVTILKPNVILFAQLLYLIFKTLTSFIKEKFINYIFHEHFVLIKKLVDTELEVSIYKAAQNVSENRILELEKENQQLRELMANIEFENVVLKTAATVLENRMEALNVKCLDAENGNEKFPHIIKMIEKMKADSRKALRSYPKVSKLLPRKKIDK
ncbi:hypothetical protein Glove_217g217 [Diversispora epigaea]|uniref:Uncharacterized protein n=1 Tax=Diversispora epigaea TaxID=1348612 RepID=A0A397IQ70_9GLOM|nr:hypothetical protein Glove_217g217 [Diversispora epigaea]